MRYVAALVILAAVAPIGYAQAPVRDGSLRTTGTASIHGRVLADRDEPLRNAHVHVTSGDESVGTLLTDGDGRFVVPSLAAGSYRVAASKSGYVTTSFGSRGFRDPGTVIPVGNQAIVEEIELRLPKAAAISGRILDDRGEPVIGMAVTVEMVTLDTDGRLNTVVVAKTQLDDLGEYRVGRLPEGMFRVSVDVAQPVLGPNGMPFASDVKMMSISVDGHRVGVNALAPQRIYFPGVGSLAESQTIALAMGEERASLDFSVPGMSPRTWVSALGGRPVDSRPGTGTIRGRVTRVEGRPLPSVAVRVVSDNYPGIPPSTITDADGRYELSGLASATFRVVAERSGFLGFEYGQRRAFEPGESIALRAGESRGGIDMSLPVPGAIAGRVLDDRGDPVEGATVRVLQARYEMGRPRLVDAPGLGTHRTDDLGRYRVYGLRPGQYIVSAVVGQVTPGQATTDLPGYAPTYFPGTPDPGHAQWVGVDLSAQMTGIDFTLSRVATARVLGIRLNEAGDPAGGSLILSPSRRSGSVAPLPVGARTYPDGRFEFPNVAPGEYVLQASTPGTNGSTKGEFASMFVTVNGVDVRGLVLRTSSGSTIKGHVTLEGSREPWLWSEVTLSALPVDLDLSPLVGTDPARAGVRTDWTFDLAGISGPRLIRVTNVPPAWTLKAVRLNGIDVTDTPLPFGTKDQSISGLEVILTDQISELSGTVTDGAWPRPRELPDHCVCDRPRVVGRRLEICDDDTIRARGCIRRSATAAWRVFRRSCRSIDRGRVAGSGSTRVARW